MKKTFPADGPVEATLKLLSGFVAVEASDRDDIDVEVVPTDSAKSRDVREAERTDVDFSGGRLTVSQTKSVGRLLTGPKGSTEVSVRLPRGSRLTVDSSYGSVTIVGEVAPGSSLETSYGDVTAGELEDAHLRTSYGEISVAALRGRSHVKGGSVRIGELSGETSVTSGYGSVVVGIVAAELSATTSYGDIEIGTVLASVIAKTAYGKMRIADAVRGALSLDSSYGSLEIGIREGTAAWLDLSSQHGAVRNALTSADAPGDDDTFDTLEVRARTSAGDITVRRAQLGR